MDFPFSLAPGQTITVNTRQSYLYYESGSAGGVDASIRVSADIGDEIVLKPGQGFRYGGLFNRLYLTNYKGQGTIVGHIVLEAGEFFDNRVVGSVEIIDGGRNRTSANMAFAGSGFCTAVAAQFPQVQLWNPAGSGVNAVIGAIILSSGQATPGGMGLLIGSSSGALANMQTYFTSKQSGGAASKSQLRNGASAVQPSSVAGMSGLISLNSAAGVSQIYKFLEPIVVQPGAGLVIWGNTPGNDISGAFEFYEQGINA